MQHSNLSETLDFLCGRSAAAVIARSRLADTALNAALLRRLSAAPGTGDALLSAPVFETARIWETADRSHGALAGNLLHPDLVAALDRESKERIPRDRHPYAHQLAAWEAAAKGTSCLVTSGTGSGKTECFMIPMLDDLLRDPIKGRLSGVRAIVIYPLNALIESQRERLAAWTEALKHRITFALYNGLTPEKCKDGNTRGKAELGDRKSIRETPPSILITNVTMLEYLLLRSTDQPILEHSQGLLRWIVLDEAHGYVGAQAAEMALLLRRVRAAFGVKPENVRLIATSATISEGGKEETESKLRRFVADLAGLNEASVRVIEGREAEPQLPKPSADTPIDSAALSTLTATELWQHLAPHPRLQSLRRKMKSEGLRLTNISEILFNSTEQQAQAQIVLDAAARAEDPATRQKLLPWRAHLFHRAQGGLWVCIDPTCPHRDPELAQPDSGWHFGAVWVQQKDHCPCGAPVFELLACTECGTAHLVAGRESGMMSRLIPHRNAEDDAFMIDHEPDPDAEEEQSHAVRDTVWLRPARQDGSDQHVCVTTGTLYENGAPEGERSIALNIIETDDEPQCCAAESKNRLRPQRYGSPFFMGTVLPDVLERLAEPLPESTGLPMGGRRAITFSDSRQGVARLAAKLQQDAERSLTRSFLYHAVQEEQGLSAEERVKKEKTLKLFRQQPDAEDYADAISALEKELNSPCKPIPWTDLIRRFGAQTELREFLADIWRERDNTMAEQPKQLAEMLLYRELFRRPRVQNNAETMGLVRLAFPDMEAHAQLADIPQALREAGVTPEGWLGLVYTAIDLVFRDNFAVHLPQQSLARWINHRRPGGRSVFAANVRSEDISEKYPITWPRPKPHLGKPSRLHRLIYRLIQGSPESAVDQERARQVLDALWHIITDKAAKDCGRGAWRLDFTKAAVARVEQGWRCPITRRILAYTTGGPSPYAPDDERPLTLVTFPQLPCAHAGGLTGPQQQQIRNWIKEDSLIATLREQGLWTDLHDRIAVYPPFCRAQEHSAQIVRPILQRYEEEFKQGQINLLNCTTTMEMGVDIPNVALVANGNVPPAISNYRQRVGRAGRRGEPWAFALTFCRDLPLDHVVFEDPQRFLTAAIAAPAVRLDSRPVVMRHVQAALLGAFLRSRSGMSLTTSIGVFLGARQPDATPDTPETLAGNLADDFLIQLRTPDFIATQQADLARLLQGTALEGQNANLLCAETAQCFEEMLRKWRTEYGQLLERMASARENDIREAFKWRAKRMHGEFLLSELARRGFTPSYGFPVDVVSFNHVRRHQRDTQEPSITFAASGGASRTLDVAIREYAPGAEIVIDGLVYQSAGLQPAWSASADASKLEDLQAYWECDGCQAFGIVRTLDEARDCPQCSKPNPKCHNTLRPAGFLGENQPHTGYDTLVSVPFEMPKLAARTPWQVLPDPAAGRLRADPAGHLVTQSSGIHGHGYALCLCCGRAEAETDALRSADVLKLHFPLAPVPKERLVKGRCPGGVQHSQIQRNLRLIHETCTDVFELQLPAGYGAGTALALAAGLREALAEKLGAEAREIGLATGSNRDPTGGRALSAFLYDRAAGGAGLVTRLAEDVAWFGDRLARAAELLDCPEKCDHGCPACILRPDMNFGSEFPDRPEAHALAQLMLSRLKLPQEWQLFGLDTRLVDSPLTHWLERQRLAGKLRALTVYLHGTPAEWEIIEWPVLELLRKVETATLVMSDSALTDKDFDIGQKLDLYRLCGQRVRLARASVLPTIAGAPLLAHIETDQHVLGVAAVEPDCAIPGAHWGMGESRPLVSGMVSSPIPLQMIEPDRLIVLSGGNAHMIRLGKELDGPAALFGAQFWKSLQAANPLAIAAIQQHGVREVIYRDRYLLTPLNVMLLHQVVASLPGKWAKMRISIVTAESNTAKQPGYLAYHAYQKDVDRKVGHL
jgi:DEAD/DEAH box helicase domain-containing protein